MRFMLPIVICLAILTADPQSLVAQSVEKASVSPAEFAQSLRTDVNRAKDAAVISELSRLRIQLAILQKRREESTLRFEEAKHQLDVWEDELGKADLSVEAYAEIVKMLQTRRVELVIQIEGIKARLESLTQLSKEKAESSQATLAQVVAFHSQAIQIAEKILAHETNQRDANSPTVLERQLQLKKAQLDLAVAEAELSKASSAAVPELISLTTDRAEKSAQLRIVQELLAEVAKARPRIKEISTIREDIKLMSGRLSELDSEFSRLSVEMEVLREIVAQDQPLPESTGHGKEK